MIAGSTVYLVREGGYYDNEVVAVFATEASAQAHADLPSSEDRWVTPFYVNA